MTCSAFFCPHFGSNEALQAIAIQNAIERFRVAPGPGTLDIQGFAGKAVSLSQSVSRRHPRCTAGHLLRSPMQGFNVYASVALCLSVAVAVH